MGASTIKCWSTGEKLPTRTGAPQEAVGIRYITFAVRGLAPLCQQLEDRGARIALRPREVGGVFKIMFVEDPDGNCIEFGEPIQS